MDDLSIMFFKISEKHGLLTTPLQKVVTGGVLLALSFIVSAIVEFKLETTYPSPPTHTTARLAFHNGFGFDNESQCQMDVLIQNLPNNAIQKELNLKILGRSLIMTKLCYKFMLYQILGFQPVFHVENQYPVTVCISKLSDKFCKGKYLSVI